jgi:hypothetical protein
LQSINVTFGNAELFLAEQPPNPAITWILDGEDNGAAQPVIAAFVFVCLLPYRSWFQRHVHDSTTNNFAQWQMRTTTRMLKIPSLFHSTWSMVEEIGKFYYQIRQQHSMRSHTANKRNRGMEIRCVCVSIPLNNKGNQ